MKLSDVSSKYGAPMGRGSDNPANFEGKKIHLAEVRLDNGGYDNGGAYWGHGKTLYRAWYDLDGKFCEYFFRAGNRNEAKKVFPNSKFYR